MTRPIPVLLSALLLGGVLLLALAGCTGSPERRVTVLAAASLTETFEELAATFEADHPGVQVDLVLESSASLAEQVRQGAPGDVLATADERSMRSVASAGALEGATELFASNRIVIAVPTGDDARVSELDDLEDPDVRYVVCVPAAPCGHVARAALELNGIDTPPASEEVDVKAVLTKVRLGEADAGLVYATDVRSSGGSVRALDLPGGRATVTRYAAAVLRDAEEPALARAWLDLLTSSRGRAVLDDAGFGRP